MNEIEGLIALAREGAVKVSASDIQKWMRSEHLEIGGAAYTLLREFGRALQIEPPLSPSDRTALFRSYLESCLKAGQGGPWYFTRHGAAWEIASWVAALFDKGGGSASHRQDMKDWLATLRGEPVRERSA